MKLKINRVISAVLALIMVLSLVVSVVPSAEAATFSYNTGKRNTVCTSLSTQAKSYYTSAYSYSTLSSKSASSLKSSLSTLMTSTHSYYTTYENLKTYTKYSDANAGSSSKVVDFYTSATYSGTWDAGKTWNREHVWCQSLGTFTTKNCGADLHHLRPTDPKVNSTRNNLPYGEITGTYKTATTAAGVVGGYYTSTRFEPLDNVKGDIARILLYCYVRWGENNLTDVIQSVDVLLQWCKQDPVDTWEMSRNDVVQNIQGNRNVFIDYPEYAWLIFGKSVPSMKTPSGKAAGSTSSGTTSGTTSSGSGLYTGTNNWIPNSVQSIVFNATYYANKYSDLKNAFGTDGQKLYQHFLDYGAKEGRQASAIFSVNTYLSSNADLKAAFGTDYKAAIKHFASNGINEERVTAPAANLGTGFTARINVSTATLNLSLLGTDVISYTPSTAAAQIWKFDRQSNGTYKITNTKTGQVLDLYAAAKTAGSKVQIYDSNNTAAQRWYIYESGTSGKYIFRPACAPGIVMGVKGDSAASSTAIESVNYKNTNGQKFGITKITSSTTSGSTTSGTTYKKVTSASALTSGNYILVVKVGTGANPGSAKYYALKAQSMNTSYVAAVSADSFMNGSAPSSITVSDSSIVWKLNGSSTGFSLANGSKSLIGSSNNLYYKAGTATQWKATYSSGTWTIKNGTRYLALRPDLVLGSNGCPRFRCNASASSTNYKFYLYKQV